jgi:hypothetical protein
MLDGKFWMEEGDAGVPALIFSFSLSTGSIHHPAFKFKIQNSSPVTPHILTGSSPLLRKLRSNVDTAVFIPSPDATASPCDSGKHPVTHLGIP